MVSNEIVSDLSGDKNVEDGAVNKGELKSNKTQTASGIEFII